MYSKFEYISPVVPSPCINNSTAYQHEVRTSLHLFFYLSSKGADTGTTE